MGYVHSVSNFYPQRGKEKTPSLNFALIINTRKLTKIVDKAHFLYSHHIILYFNYMKAFLYSCCMFFIHLN